MAMQIVSFHTFISGIISRQAHNKKVHTEKSNHRNLGRTSPLKSPR